MRTRIRTALTAAATTAGVISLASCSLISSTGSSGSNETNETGAVPSTAQETSSSETPGTQPTDGPTASPAGVPEIPEGHQEVTAPTANITFAIPEDWAPLENLTDEQVEMIASGSGITADQFRSTTEQLDIFYFATTADENGFTPNTSVLKLTSPAVQKPTEQQVQGILQQNGATLDSYETIQAINGEGYMATYTLPTANGEVKGVLLFLPNSTGHLTAVYVSGSSAEQTRGIADTVIATAH